LEDNRELLFAKRAPNRLNAYKFLVEKLSEDHMHSFVNDNYETLFEAIENSSKKGDIEEKNQANFLTSILYTYLEDKTLDEYIDKRQSTLKEMLKNDSSKLRSSSTAALTMGSFVANDVNHKQDLELMNSILASMRQIFEKDKDDHNLVLMLRSWAVLASDIPAKSVEETVFNEDLPFIVSMLESGDVELRLCSTEVIAMLCEIMKNYYDSQEDNEFNLSDYENLIDVDEMYEKMNNKKNFDPPENKKRFKKAIECLESGSIETVTDDITICSTKRTFSSWRLFNQLNFMRELVGKGNANHLTHNDQLRKAFDIRDSDSKWISKGEQMFLFETNKKKKKLSINKQRKNKNAVRNIDDDD